MQKTTHMFKLILFLSLILIASCAENIDSQILDNDPETSLDPDGDINTTIITPIDLALLGGEWTVSSCTFNGSLYEKRYFTFTDDQWFVSYRLFNDSNCVTFNSIKTEYFYMYYLANEVIAETGVGSRTVEIDGPYTEDGVTDFFELTFIMSYIDNCLYLPQQTLPTDWVNENVLNIGECAEKLNSTL